MSIKMEGALGSTGGTDARDWCSTCFLVTIHHPLRQQAFDMVRASPFREKLHEMLRLRDIHRLADSNACSWYYYIGRCTALMISG